MGETEIRAMRPGSFLINASRGRVVDVEAMAAALRDGHLLGGAADVFPDEPTSAREDERRTGTVGRQVAHDHRLRQLRDGRVLLAAEHAQFASLRLAESGNATHPMVGEIGARRVGAPL